MPGRPAKGGMEESDRQAVGGEAHVGFVVQRLLKKRS
jgi:hypothetical protein